MRAGGRIGSGIPQPTKGRRWRRGGSGAEGSAMRGIYRDHRDRLRASVETFPSLLADFLEADVRENPLWCEELLQGLDAARGGKRFLAAGDRYRLEAGPEGAELRNGLDDRLEPLHLAIADMKRALAAWRRAIG